MVIRKYDGRVFVYLIRPQCCVALASRLLTNQPITFCEIMSLDGFDKENENIL